MYHFQLFGLVLFRILQHAQIQYFLVNIDIPKLDSLRLDKSCRASLDAGGTESHFVLKHEEAYVEQ